MRMILWPADRLLPTRAGQASRPAGMSIGEYLNF
jgi:hypothetical protein